MKSKIISALLIIMILFGTVILTGCGRNLTREEFDEGAVKKLEQLYSDNLSITKSGIGYGGDVFGKGSNVELILKSEKFPNEEIKMRYSYDSKTKDYKLYGSNYNFVRYKDKIVDRLKVLTEIYPEYKINLKSDFDKDNNYTFDQYISAKKYLDVYIFLPPSAESKSKESDIEKIRLKLKQSKILVSCVDVIYVKDQNLYNSINPDNIDANGNLWGALRGDKKCLEGTFYMNSDYEWYNTRWINE